ncbi:UDP-N-acetylmuramate dehydrogenase [Schaalia sp. ZJ1691]|uniref:UDP-N-acetylmuramate dehydrogenase n=1 Tax=Schaalia sp. ZJ1691 TaxID=2709404 RepID=UPI0013EB664D|nr:UDP-N-acetylmuramate dehydrogenase [Schaalia sp. ZJ1691]
MSAPTLADLTTLRVGGPVAQFVRSQSESEFIEAVAQADATGLPLLVIGGGSNLLASDAPFEGVVVSHGVAAITQHPAPAVGAGPLPDGEGAPVSSDTSGDEDEAVRVIASAGTTWDELVAWTVDRGLSGLEALSGIPGTVGAAPVQNIGAYGHEVAEFLESIRAWDRQEHREVTLTREQMAFGYRTSVIKRSILESGWGPTGRWVVLEVTFRLRRSHLSAPILYSQLASSLDVEQGDVVASRRVREAVLSLRASKGMVLTPGDHDTWSAGSFFTNPIIPSSAASVIDEDAPRYPAGEAADGTPLVKTSAAWLIEHAGFTKGFALPGEGRAALSSRHVLALTNRGGATAREIADLARAIQRGVEDTFGIHLVPEPVCLGIDL